MSHANLRGDLVFCHVCENEWYREEHGLTCPSCHSDFCEVIEADHDPRAEMIADEDVHTDDYVPDPDEADIGNVSNHQIRSTFTIDGQPAGTTHTSQPSPDQSQRNQQDTQDAPMGGFASMLHSIMGYTMPTNENWGTGRRSQSGTTSFGYSNGRMFYSYSSSGGTPTTTRQGTAMSEDMGQVMASIFAPLLQNHPHPGLRGPEGMPANPFNSFFSSLLNPANAAHGDVAYTQEAFDRIMSQLMEQNQNGSAPGPATADEIARLPKQKVDKAMLGENGKAECTICMDEVSLGDEVTMLYCNHWFHEDCVTAWLNNHDTCPHCRMSLKESREKADEKQKKQRSVSASGQANQAEASSSRPRTGLGSRHSSSYSFTRHRSNTSSNSNNNGMSPTSQRQRSGSSPAGSSVNSNAGRSANSGGGGLMDRARNFFRGSPG